MYKVLLADDEVYMRQLMKKLIRWEDSGFSVAAEAADGEEAIALAGELQPDLVFADLEMPFVSGIELAEQLRENHPEILTVFLTGYDEFAYAQAAIRFGVQEYMLKPVSPEELLAVLGRMRAKLDERRSLNRSLLAGEGATRLIREELAAILRRRNSEEIAAYVHAKLSCMGVPGVRESRDAILGVMMDALEGYCREFGLLFEGAGIHDSDAVIIHSFVRAVCGGEEKQNHHDRMIQTVRDYILENYGDPELTLARIAENIYLNPSYLSRLFAQVTGESILTFIREVRLSRAMDMLRSGVTSIELIAYKVGYRNAGYFSKCFREKYGMVPSDFRRPEE